MTLLFTDGFDAGDKSQKWDVDGGTVSTDTAFGSGRSQAGGGVAKVITPSASLYVGVRYKCSALNRRMLRFYTDNGATQQLFLDVGSTGVINGYQGLTLIASSTLTFSPATWAYVEMFGTVADSGGRLVVKVNGTTYIDFTGDTRNGGTSTLIDRVELVGDSGVGFDDVYICDANGSVNNDFLGDIRILTMLPTGAGSSTQFTPTGSASNWDNVNDVPLSTTTYNASGTVGNRDLYAMSDIATGYTVKAAVENLVVAKSDAGVVSAKTAIKSGASVYTGSAVSVGTGFRTVQTVRETDPATSAAWTVSAVNAIEAGAEVA